MREKQPLQRAAALAILATHQDDLRGFGVRSLALFGSVARDEARPDSDVDILVEFDGPATFRSLLRSQGVS